MSLREHVHFVRTLAKREWRYWRRALRACSLQPTYRCNLRCRMCGVPRLQKPGDESRELSRAEMLRIVEELAAMGGRRIILVGGEPFLRAGDMMAVTARAQACGIQTTIVTNATLLNQEIVRDCLAAGLRRICVSVDGVGAAHDRVRGSGAFESARSGLLLLLEEKRRQNSRYPFVVVQSVISRLNWDQVEPLQAFTHEIGADTLFLKYVKEVSMSNLETSRLDGESLCSYRWAPLRDSLLFSRSELAAFREALKSVPEDDNIRILKSLDDDFYLKGVHFPTRCYAMRELMIINPYGEVYPCLHMDRYVVGSIRQQNLRALWQNERHRKVIDARQKAPFPVCGGCEFYQENMTPWQWLRLRWFRGR